MVGIYKDDKDTKWYEIVGDYVEAFIHAAFFAIIPVIFIFLGVAALVAFLDGGPVLVFEPMVIRKVIVAWLFVTLLLWFLMTKEK